MTTQQLTTFIYVAENLNFARAAELLNITQSACFPADTRPGRGAWRQPVSPHNKDGYPHPCRAQFS